jgi:hypothetical protein
MLNDEDYDILKDNFISSKRLFDKLNRVADQYNEIEPDESGFSLEDEETLQRHWKKLSSKIVDSLSLELPEYTIELVNYETLNQRELQLNLIKDDEISKICVDYAQRESFDISQIS